MSLIIFLLVLSVLVLIHEFGHFVAARIFKVKAEEFGVGFPPRAAGLVKDRGTWKFIGVKDRAAYKNTIWSLNWLPLGGFVRLKGEQEDGINDPDSIHKKPIWQRMIIIAAGVVMNWLLAVVLFTGLLYGGTLAFLEGVPAGASIKDRTILISSVLPGSPAAASGLAASDELVSIGGDRFEDAEEARDAIKSYGTSQMEIVIKRQAEEKSFTLHPKFIKEISRPGLGVALSDVGTVSFPLHLAAQNAVLTTAVMTKAVVFAFGDIFRDLFVSRKVAEEVAGPVAIAVIAGQIAKQGVAPLIQFAAVLSVNLAVINFLPIPALDGGRVLFLVIEKIRRRPIKRHLEISIHNIAFLILILLIILVTARDLFRYGGMILGGMKGMIGM